MSAPVTHALAGWVAQDLEDARARLRRGILDLVPAERLAETVDGGGIPPLYVLWHLARHHDVAVNSVLRGRPQFALDRAAALGLAGAGPTDGWWRGLSEGSDHELIALLDPAAVVAYADDLLADTVSWLGGADAWSGALADLTVDAGATTALEAMGTPTDDFDWLYGMWDGKPKRWFLSWEAVAHVVTHTGELTSLRNRMGLSPF